MTRFLDCIRRLPDFARNNCTAAGRLCMVARVSVQKMTSPHTPLLQLGEGLKTAIFYAPEARKRASLSLRRRGTEGEVKGLKHSSSSPCPPSKGGTRFLSDEHRAD